ncbi:hypothetical protein ACET3Z_015778 [Daucus carota]
MNYRKQQIAAHVVLAQFDVECMRHMVWQSEKLTASLEFETRTTEFAWKMTRINSLKASTPLYAMWLVGKISSRPLIQEVHRKVQKNFKDQEVVTELLK